MNSAAIWMTCAALALATPALAQTDCTRPTAPATVDGSTVTMEQLMTAKADTAAFITASDDFQSCVIKSLETQRAAAKADKKKMDQAVVKAANAQIGENQKDKERVGSGFNAAVRAYKKAHPS